MKALLLLLLLLWQAAASSDLAEAFRKAGHSLATLGDAHRIPSGGSRDTLGYETRDARPSQRRHFNSRHRLHNRQTNATATSATLADGSGSWHAAFVRAKALVGQMTLDEKANITTGTGDTVCVGGTGAVPRLGLPALCLQDGPTGVRSSLNVSQFPAEVSAAATWDVELIAERGRAIGQEFLDRGAAFMFGPVTGGPLGRSPLGGRNWEGFGSDEYLSGQASYASVRASQETGIVACSKHWLAYEQETSRNIHLIFGNLQQPISSDVDDLAAHQLYAWSFAEAVRAGTGMVMCSYNRVNGSHACESDRLLNGLLKHELNFQGSVVSDYGAAYSGVDSVNGGLDLLMPGAGLFGVFPNYFGSHGSKLADAVRDGKVSQARLDDMVIRILTPVLHYQLHDTSNVDEIKQPNFDANAFPSDAPSVQRDHYKVIRRLGTESVTLLKNANNTLPLQVNHISRIAVIGQDAVASSDDQASCNALGSCLVSDQGTRTNGEGSGFTTPPYVIDPLSALRAYTLEHNPRIKITSSPQTLFSADPAKAAEDADVALVFVSALGQEGQDRSDLKLDRNGDELIKKVAKVNNNTVVVVHAPGPVLMEEWIDSVAAVLFAYYPGQESGASLTPVLFGDESPSGKLPFVIGKSLDDWPPNTIVNRPFDYTPSANFSEGLLTDWKWFDAHGIEPRFAFGHGLSYSAFHYSPVAQAARVFEADDGSLQPTKETFAKADPFTEGSSLYDVVLHVSARLTNTGGRTAKEVAQLYVTLPDSAGPEQPHHLLRGFRKVQLDAGQTKTVTFKLRRKDISVWNVVQQQWAVPTGRFRFFVQGSSGQWDAGRGAKGSFTV